jgi:hypothetical protein
MRCSAQMPADLGRIELCGVVGTRIPAAAAAASVGGTSSERDKLAQIALPLLERARDELAESVWSTHSRRIDPISHSEKTILPRRAAMGLSLMPMARNRRVTQSHVPGTHAGERRKPSTDHDRKF